MCDLAPDIQLRAAALAAAGLVSLVAIRARGRGWAESPADPPSRRASLRRTPTLDSADASKDFVEQLAALVSQSSLDQVLGWNLVDDDEIDGDVAIIASATQPE